MTNETWKIYFASSFVRLASRVGVAVVENGAARLRKIQVARDLGKAIEVRDGVKDGEEVILNPSVDLVDGSRVRVQSNTTRPSPAAEAKRTS